MTLAELIRELQAVDPEFLDLPVLVIAGSKFPEGSKGEALSNEAARVTQSRLEASDEPYGVSIFGDVAAELLLRVG